MLHFAAGVHREGIRSAVNSSPWLRKHPFTHGSRKIISQCSFLKYLRLLTCGNTRVIP